MKLSEIKSSNVASMNSLQVISCELENISLMDIDQRIESINEIKKMLSKYSPLNYEPVDCVVWVRNSEIKANDYNPNSVAPPEMALLHTSIEQDGYTQPIVSWQKEDGTFEVVDGFHRNRVGKEYQDIEKRVHGYLPLTIINDERKGKMDRMASTIRHNRARGKHSVDSMSSIVMELKKRNWSNQKIAKNLGMDEDEILRLSQLTGLTEMFSNQDFSKSWDIGNEDFDIDAALEEIDG